MLLYSLFLPGLMRISNAEGWVEHSRVVVSAADVRAPCEPRSAPISRRGWPDILSASRRFGPISVFHSPGDVGPPSADVRCVRPNPSRLRPPSGQLSGPPFTCGCASESGRSWPSIGPSGVSGRTHPSNEGRRSLPTHRPHVGRFPALHTLGTSRPTCPELRPHQHRLDPVSKRLLDRWLSRHPLRRFCVQVSAFEVPVGSAQATSRNLGNAA